MKKRFVVTGLGLICAVGNDVESCWQNICAGQSGIRKVESISTEGCSSHVGGEVRCTELPAPEFDRSVRLCLHAEQEAVADAGLTDLSDAGVILGSCVGGAASIDRYYTAKQTGKTESEVIPHMTASAIACNTAYALGAGGEIANIVNACAAGTMSIAYACDLIGAGRGEVFLAGGTDAFSSLAFAGFHALHALSPEPCRPLNRSDGISLGEGAGIVVVESYEHAIARGAKIYCEITGWGVSSDAFHITAPQPQGEGQLSAICRAMQRAGVSAADIGYVNAHGTGTAKNDAAEFLSLHTLFDGADVSVSSTKSMTGHWLGAAGAIEAVLSVKALTCQILPPTTGYTPEDLVGLAEKAGTLDCVVNTAREKELHQVMSNSFAFGGTNSSIIFSDHPHPSDAVEKRPLCVTGVSSLLGERVELTAEAFAQREVKLGFYRKLDRFSQMQLLSGIDALRDAEYTVTGENAPRLGSVIGTADGPLAEITAFQQTVCEKGTAAGSAFSFPNTVYNAAGGHLSIFTGLKGFCATIANGKQAGLQSVCCAGDMLRSGTAEAMLASGTDELSENILELYGQLGVQNLGEGSATVLLETRESAEKRGARVYAMLLGYAMIHRPVPFGISEEVPAEESILAACKDAGIARESVEHVFSAEDGRNCRAASATAALVQAVQAVAAGRYRRAAVVCGGWSGCTGAVIIGRDQA